MKKSIITLICVFGSTLFLHAAVLTVSNHPNGGSQFTSIQAAYDSAAVGDTIYLEGTNIPYALDFAVYFDKSLTIVGIGFNANVIPGKQSIIAGTAGFGSFQMRPGSSGSSFYGITFSSSITFNQSLSNIVFENCLFESEINFNAGGSGIVVRNCIFDGNNNRNISMSSSAVSTLVMTNCVLDGYIDGNTNNLNTVSIDHCVFLKTENSNGIFYRLPDATISNSIVMNSTTIAGTGTTGCSFVNNIVATVTTMPPAGNVGSGNLTNTDPLFVNYTAPQNYSPAHDYDVQGGSAAINGGSDATDIGVHGGTSFFSEFGEVLTLPIIRNVIILNSSVAPNGTINVQVEASRPAQD